MTFGIFIIGYFFIGIEVIEREDSKVYDPFIKAYPTTKFYFYNPVLCGTCDFHEYKMLNDAKMEKEFRKLCYYRYDLKDIVECEDIFRSHPGY